jgi:type IV pilus assembly protein PilM
MLGLVQSWFAPTGNPIGIDFGTDGLRMAQVEPADGEYRLAAAASAEVPASIRQDPAARLTFFTETVRDRLASGNFKGRRAILSLPAASCFIQHLRLPRLEAEELKKALPWEARGKLPIDPSHALLRHIVAGEVYQDSEQKLEVILLAAARELVNQLLAAAARAKVDVVGMNVEPKAIVDCFTHIYRRKSDAEQTACYVDIGCSGTRATIARGPQILFARAIPVGGDHFNRAVASALKMSLEDAKVLRIKVCSLGAPAPAGAAAPEAQPRQAAQPQSLEQAFPLLGAGMKSHGGATAVAPAPVHQAPHAVQAAVGDPVSTELMEKARLVEQACREPLSKLTEELDLCRRYHESTFSSRPIDRLVFVGGEARHRNLCQQIARQMSLAAQVGDPMVRMGRTSEVGVESGIDRRQPQPSWSVAIGLSMGPISGSAPEGKK